MRKRLISHDSYVVLKVREMSLKCIADVLTDKNADPKVVENLTSKAVQSMIQQSAEKIGRTRQVW